MALMLPRSKHPIVHSVITSYLLQQKQCVLPGLGKLELITIPTISDFVNRQLVAPRQEVRFSENSTTDNDLIQYIASRQQLNHSDAEKALHTFCNSLSAKIEAGEAAELPGLGGFTKNASGKVVFTMTPLPAGYEMAVPAERVVRPSAEHQVLVGDLETTNTAMADFFATNPESRRPWWIAPLVLTLLSLGIIGYQYIQHPAQGLTGNAHRITPATPPVTYIGVK